jgi:hypothetical protein
LPTESSVAVLVTRKFDGLIVRGSRGCAKRRRIENVRRAGIGTVNWLSGSSQSVVGSTYDSPFGGVWLMTRGFCSAVMPVRDSPSRKSASDVAGTVRKNVLKSRPSFCNRGF